MTDQGSINRQNIAREASSDEALGRFLELIINQGLAPTQSPMIGKHISGQESKRLSGVSSDYRDKITGRTPGTDPMQSARSAVAALVNQNPQSGDIFAEGFPSEITTFEELLESLARPQLKLGGAATAPYPQRKPENLR